MIKESLPEHISSIFVSQLTPDRLFAILLPALGEFLQCDRVFLYLRNPDLGVGKVPFCWTKNAEIPTIYDEDWLLEPPSLAQEDPMFAAALQAKPSLFIENVETTNPQVLNLQFEQKTFGHQALIHGHICEEGKLWGVLQPCIFKHYRVWSEYEKTVFLHIIQAITPYAIAYVTHY